VSQERREPEPEGEKGEEGEERDEGIDVVRGRELDFPREFVTGCGKMVDCRMNGERTIESICFLMEICGPS
jgi:hypothetical protein